MPSGGIYWLGLSSGKPVCGLLTLEGSEGNSEPDHWVTYVHVNDLDDAVARVRTSGGKVLRAPWEVRGVGRVAWIRDPGGAEMGWVTPDQQVEK
ncbi:MAG: VOC family protein [Calditrichaceae bacterium]